MRKFLIQSFCVATLVCFYVDNVNAQTSPMQQNFTTPPDSVKPSVYYHWLNNNVSPQGVKNDIEAMAKVGIGRAFIANIGLSLEEAPSGNVKLFSDEWWKAIEQAIQTSKKEGVDIGLFNCPGWSQSGGPWIKPTETMRYLYSEEWQVKGGQPITQKLIVSKTNFQPVAVLGISAAAR